MAFNYQSAGPTGQTSITPTSKDIQCKSLKVDFSVTNATTAVAFDLGWLPKDAQFILGQIAVPTAVSGSGVTAATLSVTIGGSNAWSGSNVFAAGVTTATATPIWASPGTSTSDQKIQGTLTLTGGATATAGVIYVNILYVI